MRLCAFASLRFFGRLGGPSVLHSFIPSSPHTLIPPAGGPSDTETGTETGLLETEFGECRGLTAKPDGDAFVVGDDRKAVLPDQLLQAGHLIRFTAEVYFPVHDPSPVEIFTQRFAVRTPIGGEDEDGIERDHPPHPPKTS